MWENEELIEVAGQIIQEAQDAIIVADRQGIIRFWNKGAITVFGYAPEEVIGQPLDIIIPENLRERHNRGYQQVMQSGRSRYASELLAVPALKKGGIRLSVEFSIVLLRDSHAEIIGAAAIIRDVSARWEKERARQRRLAELEAKCQP